MVLMEWEEVVEHARLAKAASVGDVFVTEIALPVNAVLTLVVLTVVNVFPDKPVSTESVPEIVLLNVSEPSTDNPRRVVGIGAVETAEVAQKTSDAKMESVCVTLNAKARTVDLMVAVVPAVNVFKLIPETQFNVPPLLT